MHIKLRQLRKCFHLLWMNAKLLVRRTRQQQNAFSGRATATVHPRKKLLPLILLPPPPPSNHHSSSVEIEPILIDDAFHPPLVLMSGNLNQCIHRIFQFEDLTHKCDLATIIPDGGLSFGDYVCHTVNHDVQKGSSIKFRFQLCSGWQDTGLICGQSSFCCINDDYPESGCPKTWNLCSILHFFFLYWHFIINKNCDKSNIQIGIQISK